MEIENNPENCLISSGKEKDGILTDNIIEQNIPKEGTKNEIKSEDDSQSNDKEEVKSEDETEVTKKREAIENREIVEKFTINEETECTTDKIDTVVNENKTEIDANSKLPLTDTIKNEESNRSKDEKLPNEENDQFLPPAVSPKRPSAEDYSALSPKAKRNVSTVAQIPKQVANGTIPKSGKPLMAAINKKINKPRGRPKRKTMMYQSEISDNKIGIKLCIKKSETGQAKVKQTRKRSRKARHKDATDSDDSEYEKRKRKEKANNNTDKHKKSDTDYKEPEEQSVWGKEIPTEILYKIFNHVVQLEGCLPILFRLGRVCTLWRKISLSTSLWKSLDLSAGIKEKYRTEIKLKWLIENRLGAGCTELNVSHWKVSDIQCVLNKLAYACPGLTGITLAGWKGFTSDHLMFLVEEFAKLERIDLSSINVETHPSKSAVGLQSLCNAIQILNGRLTHLHLAHNRLAGVPQIISTLATNCPNLLLLDLSNVRTVAISHGVFHVEKLQQGCQKLKVLRITNSHINLSLATLQEQMDSPGFPELEELSVASLGNESRIVNDEFLQRILKTSTKLKLLDIRGCARLTHDSLIRLPTWDLKHLFLSGCSITRDTGSGLELIASKWAHSLTEFDLAWANVQQPLDNALHALAEKSSDSPLVHLNLCGSSVSEEAVKDILTNCPLLNSINLSSCRGLPRGVKRLMHGPSEIKELRDVLKVALKLNPSLTED